MSVFFNKIFIACDHAGFEHKGYIISNIYKTYPNIIISDLGCNKSDISQDYPDYAKKLCNNLKACNKNKAMGILICGSGIGMSIVANRYSFVRAALCCNEKAAKLARNHNNANVLCIGSRFCNKEQSLEMANIFLSQDFEGGRHLTRVTKIS